MAYPISKWLLTFFTYSIIGYIWEVFFVFISQKKLENRGFLFGPWLPIYGFGSLLILFSTLKVQDDLVLTYLFGMISATLLEYFTGLLMEKIFKMRYWDYSNIPMNLNGYICFPVSLGWGLFSLLLVKVINPPINNFISLISNHITTILSYSLLTLFTLDLIKSVTAAFDLKKIIIGISKNSELIQRLNNYLNEISDKYENEAPKIKNFIKTIDDNIKQKQLEFKQIIEKNKTTTYFNNKIEEFKTNITERLNSMSLKVEEIINDFGNIKDQQTENLKNNLKDIITSITKTKTDLKSRKTDYSKVLSILERNPNAKSADYQEAINKLKETYIKSDDKENKK